MAHMRIGLQPSNMPPLLILILPTSRCCRQNFSKISSLLNLLHELTVELIFENFSEIVSLPSAAAGEISLKSTRY